jgi:histidinol-phosphate phosphatase family protein
VRLLPGAADTIRAANSLGIPVVVVTNQAGIGRGYYSWHGLYATVDEMRRQLASVGAQVDAIYACPFHADARPPYDAADHPGRKPNPGMILRASRDLSIDLARSWLVGDTLEDLLTARAAGLAGAVHVLSGHGRRDRPAVERLDAALAVEMADDLGAAAAILARIVDGPRFEPTMGKPTAILLAGGRGSRLRPVVPDRPKPLAPVLGRPFIEWVLAWLAGQGIEDVVLAIGHMADRFQDWLAGYAAAGSLTIRVARESAPLGTGGALLGALSGAAEDVVVANADTLALVDVAAVVQRLRAGVDGVIVGLEVDDGSRYGRLEVDSEGRVVGLTSGAPGRQLVNAGIYAFRRDMLARLSRPSPSSLEADIIPDLIRAGIRLAAHVVEAPMIDIGTPQSLAAADRFLRAHAPELTAGLMGPPRVVGPTGRRQSR